MRTKEAAGDRPPWGRKWSVAVCRTAYDDQHRHPPSSASGKDVATAADDDDADEDGAPRVDSSSWSSRPIPASGAAFFRAAASPRTASADSAAQSASASAAGASAGKAPTTTRTAAAAAARTAQLGCSRHRARARAARGGSSGPAAAAAADDDDDDDDDDEEEEEEEEEGSVEPVVVKKAVRGRAAMMWQAAMRWGNGSTAAPGRALSRARKARTRAQAESPPEPEPKEPKEPKDRSAASVAYSAGAKTKDQPWSFELSSLSFSLFSDDGSKLRSAGDASIAAAVAAGSSAWGASFKRSASASTASGWARSRAPDELLEEPPLCAAAWRFCACDARASS